MFLQFPLQPWDPCFDPNKAMGSRMAFRLGIAPIDSSSNFDPITDLKGLGRTVWTDDRYARVTALVWTDEDGWTRTDGHPKMGRYLITPKFDGESHGDLRFGPFCRLYIVFKHSRPCMGNLPTGRRRFDLRVSMCPPVLWRPEAA